MAAHGRLTVAAIVVAGGAGVRLGRGHAEGVRQGSRPHLARALGGAVRCTPGHPRRRRGRPRRSGDRRLDGSARRQQWLPAAPPGSVRWRAAWRRSPPTSTPCWCTTRRVPFSRSRWSSRVLGALDGGAQAVVPTIALADSLRTISADGTVGGAVDRATLVAVQTPQGFARTVLDAAHGAAVSDDASDDATLVEALGVAVLARRWCRGGCQDHRAARPGDRRGAG